MIFQMVLGRTREWASATAAVYRQGGLLGAPVATGYSALFAVHQALDFASSGPFVAAAVLGAGVLLSATGVLPPELSVVHQLAQHGLSQLVDPTTRAIGYTELAGAGAQVGRRGLSRIPGVGEIIDGMKGLTQERAEFTSRRRTR